MEIISYTQVIHCFNEIINNLYRKMVNLLSEDRTVYGLTMYIEANEIFLENYYMEQRFIK